MITLKITYKASNEFYDFLEVLRREYSCLVRYSYNRLKEGMSEKDIRTLHKGLNNIDNLDAWTKQCAINEARQILNKHKENKVVFGGKSNMIKYLKGLISKPTYKDSRTLPLNIFGEAASNGNRKFKLELFNNKIFYKHSRTKHFELVLPNLRGSYKSLYKLQESPRTYSIKLTDKHIYITFEEFNESIELIKNRYMGIDLNPEYIGISIKQDDEVIYTKLYSVKQLTNSIIDLKVSSQDNKFKNLNNKLNHEILEISKDISNLSRKYSCRFVFVEALKFREKTFANK